MSGSGPSTFAGLGDLPGNAGSTNVIGRFARIAVATLCRWGARQSVHGDDPHDALPSDMRRNRMTSTRMRVALAIAWSREIVWDSVSSNTLLGLFLLLGERYLTEM